MEISIKKYMQMLRAVDGLVISRKLDEEQPLNIGDMEDSTVKELHRIVYIIADDYTRPNYQEYVDITLGEYTMICDILDIAE